MNDKLPGLTIAEVVVSLTLLSIFITTAAAGVMAIGGQSSGTENAAVALDEVQKLLVEFKVEVSDLPSCSPEPIVQYDDSISAPGLNNAAALVVLSWPDGCSKSAQISATVTYGSGSSSVTRSKYVI